MQCDGNLEETLKRSGVHWPMVVPVVQSGTAELGIL